MSKLVILKLPWLLVGLAMLVCVVGLVKTIVELGTPSSREAARGKSQHERD